MLNSKRFHNVYTIVYHIDQVQNLCDKLSKLINPENEEDPATKYYNELCRCLDRYQRFYPLHNEADEIPDMSTITMNDINNELVYHNKAISNLAQTFGKFSYQPYDHPLLQENLNHMYFHFKKKEWWLRVMDSITWLSLNILQTEIHNFYSFHSFNKSQNQWFQKDGVKPLYLKTQFKKKYL